MPNITKRDAVTGEKLEVKTQTNTPAKTNQSFAPDKPLPDLRVERFLMEIVEGSVTGTDKLFMHYCNCGFPKNQPTPVTKNEMRKLLATPEVKERLKYLKSSEWELNRPDIAQISKKFEELIDDEELTPKDKISALNSLAKLTGLFEPEQKDTGPKVAVIFNSLEKPPTVKVN